MPIYEYSCQSCGKRLELMQKFSDNPVTECPECNGPMKKLISNTSFVLKGTGWYVTDYASPERKKASEETAAPDKKDSKEAVTPPIGAVSPKEAAAPKAETPAA